MAEKVLWPIEEAELGSPPKSILEAQEFVNHLRENKKREISKSEGDRFFSLIASELTKTHNAYLTFLKEAEDKDTTVWVEHLRNYVYLASLVNRNRDFLDFASYNRLQSLPLYSRSAYKKTKTELEKEENYSRLTEQEKTTIINVLKIFKDEFLSLSNSVIFNDLKHSFEKTFREVHEFLAKEFTGRSKKKLKVKARRAFPPNDLKDDKLQAAADAKSVGEMFRQAREDLGVNKSAASRATGMATKDIRQFEDGDHSPTLRKIQKYADALDYEARLVLVPKVKSEPS